MKPRQRLRVVVMVSLQAVVTAVFPSCIPQGAPTG